MKRVYFFATPADIKPVLRRFENNAPIKFVEQGHLTSPNAPVYFSAEELPTPGIATNETGSGSISYLVLPRHEANPVESYVSTAPETAGKRRWSSYNAINESSVVMTLAGLWDADTLLPGNVSTLHGTKEAQQLMRWFLSSLKKERFIKVQSWWLGKEATEMLKSGRRLTTTAVQSPPEYDLKVEHLT